MNTHHCGSSILRLAVVFLPWLLCWVYVISASSLAYQVDVPSVWNVTRIGAKWATLEDYYQKHILSRMPVGGEEYAVPSLEVLQDIGRIVGDMMALEGGSSEEIEQQCSSIDLRSLLGKYEIGIFHDTEYLDIYCVFVTTSSDFPWGTVVVHPPMDDEVNDLRHLSIDAPHPLHDQNTAEQSIAIFQGVNARSLVISGAYRYATNETSCQGEPFRISDAAHSIQHGFHAAVAAIWKHYQQFPDLDFTSIQFHGMGPSTCQGVDAYLTHGMGSVPSGTSHPKLTSLWKHITTQFSKIQNTTFVLLPSSCIPTGSAPTSVSCSMSGSTNVQGRLWNGVPPDQICTTPANSITGHFIHLEQKAWFRNPQYFDTWVDVIRQAYDEFPTSASKSVDDYGVVSHRKRDYDQSNSS